MIQWLKKLLVLLFFTLLLSGPSAWASGKMEVGIGQTVKLTADSDLFAPTYKWVVKRGADIASTQSGKSFSYNFPLQGEYTIHLTATTEDQVENTVLYVLVGDRYPRPYSLEVSTDEVLTGEALQLRLKTLPTLNDQNQVQLLGDGRLQFLLEGSKGDILEYRIDRNIFEDSDGNGVANDDIDNADDDSYLTGGAWLTTYQNKNEPRLTAEVTLVDKNGKKARQQIDILFSDRVVNSDLKAVLQTLPEADPSDDTIHLYQDPHLVSFYSRASQGDILEYRIDRNIFEDSNGDGDPKNDIDNLNDLSFKTGDVFEVLYPKTDGQIIAQLIAVGRGGKGSRVQVGITFSEKPVISDLGTSDEAGIRLTADKSLVVKGDPITYSVEGLSLALDQYLFKWDFDGDGEYDKETEAQNSIEHIYENPGVYTIKVNIADQQGNSADRSYEVVVKDSVITKADFSYEIDQNTVQFTNLSTVDTQLANQNLVYQWNFGDTDEEAYEAQKDQIGVLNPVYTYKNNGTYIVSLTVTDTDEVVDTKTVEIEITEGAASSDEEVLPEEPADNTSQESSGFIGVLKLILYVVLFLVFLLFLIIAGFLIFLKVQYPELTFEELIDEFKVKVLTMIGAHEEVRRSNEPSAAESVDLPKPPQPSGSENVTESDSINEVSDEVVSPVAPSDDDASSSTQEQVIDGANSNLNSEVSNESASASEPVGDGPMPAWLQNKQVIEGEVEDSADLTIDNNTSVNEQSSTQGDQLTDNSEVQQEVSSSAADSNQGQTSDAHSDRSENIGDDTNDQTPDLNVSNPNELSEAVNQNSQDDYSGEDGFDDSDDFSDSDDSNDFDDSTDDFSDDDADFDLDESGDDSEDFVDDLGEDDYSGEDGFDDSDDFSDSDDSNDFDDSTDDFSDDDADFDLDESGDDSENLEEGSDDLDQGENSDNNSTNLPGNQSEDSQNKSSGDDAPSAVPDWLKEV